MAPSFASHPTNIQPREDPEHASGGEQAGVRPDVENVHSHLDKE